MNARRVRAHTLATVDRPKITPEMLAYVYGLAKLRGQPLPAMRLYGRDCPEERCHVTCCGVTAMEAADNLARHRRHCHG